MGYELKILYHPKGEDGYDLSDTKSNSKRIGKATDEPNDAQLAKEILKQFSRRDVLVTDVEVSEFIKKSLKVKTAKNGCVIIRGKKYSLDNQEVQDAEDIDEKSDSESSPGSEIISTTVVAEKKPVETSSASGRVAALEAAKNQKVIRKEVYDPPREDLGDQYSNLGIKIGVSVGILEEKEGLRGKIYKVLTPKGTEAMIPADYFVSASPGLSWGETVVPENNEVDLGFGSNYNGPGSEIPNLR